MDEMNRELNNDTANMEEMQNDSINADMSENKEEPSSNQETTNFVLPDCPVGQPVQFINSFTSEPKDKIKKVKNKSGKGKKAVKKAIALVSAAAVFGAVAGAGYQGVNYLADRIKKPSNSAVGAQTVGEFEDYANDTSNNVVSTGSVISSGNTIVNTTDVSQVVENVMPSIVSINSTATMTVNDFFGRYEQDVSGSGSGIIIGQNADELLIATNNHVVDGAKTLEIVFIDDTKADGTVKGTEPGSDLAVVSVKMSELSKDTINSIRVATLGDSTQVKTGEMAIAIGNALGYGQSVTVGYISALNREVTVENTTSKLIQTDAAINPGNSGGALLNLKGEIIGINSVKYASTDVEGIGYAIPISDVIPIINELMNREDLKASEMGYLGIKGKNIDSGYSQGFNMPVGIYVSEVTEGEAAEKAGIVKGNIIVGINGKKLETMQDLSNTLTYTRGGTTVTINLKVLENGEYVDKDVEVKLGFRGKKG